MHGPVSRLSACALGFAFAVLGAVMVTVVGVLAWHFHVGEAWVNTVSSLYMGFALTPKGIMIGAIWGFVEGFVVGWIVAGVYNFVIKHCCNRTDSPKF